MAPAPNKTTPFDPTAYAQKRKEKIERAAELRNARASKLAPSDEFAGELFWAFIFRVSLDMSIGFCMKVTMREWLKK